jgi:formylglycine-generating enzyme required for sulfatase activity
MGSTIDETGHEDDEGPQVDVVVEPFYIGKYEVTQPEYTEFLSHYNIIAGSGAASGVSLPQARWADAVTYPTPFYELEAGAVLGRMGRGAGFPAVIMSHYAARQYTKWLSRKTGRFYRLATEAEWEYACRAGTTTAYHFGDDPAALGDYAWTFDNAKLPDGEPGYHPVGKKLPNAWGLHDMHGNVAEWVIDRYDPKHYKTLAEQSPAGGEGTPIAAARAVVWPTKRYARSIRGGGYESEATDCRSAARFGSNTVLNNRDPMLPKSSHWESNGFWVGFRVVCPVREPSDAEKHRYWDEEDPAALGPIIHSNDRQIRDLVPPYP